MDIFWISATVVAMFIMCVIGATINDVGKNIVEALHRQARAIEEDTRERRSIRAQASSLSKSPYGYVYKGYVDDQDNTHLNSDSDFSHEEWLRKMHDEAPATIELGRPGDGVAGEL